MTDLLAPGRSAPPLVSEFEITDRDWRHIGLVWDGSRRVLYGGRNHSETPFSREKGGVGTVSAGAFLYNSPLSKYAW